MYKISIPTGHLKKVTQSLSNSNKLSSTFNITKTGIIVKEVDLEKVLNLICKLELKVSTKKVA